jgi:CRISPR/Cas system-associated exonuclease Cas4 (RecB family)
MDFQHKLLNIPSGSHFERLVNCRASHALSIQARRLGQVAHEDSEAARQGTRIHEARHTGNVDQLSSEECELFENLKRREQTLLSQWTIDPFPIPEQRSEVRLYLRREGHFLPVLTGQPDLVFVQGSRALIIDCKLGRNRVADPCENWQLKIYAILLSRTETYLEEVTAQILSPYFDFEPVTYGREELDQLYRSVLVVVASLEDPGEPVPGDHCHFCPARLICSAAKDAAVGAMLTKVAQLPTGEGAAELLAQIKRAQALFKEIEGYYKRLLEETPGAIPGWLLEPGDVRRSIEDTVALHKHTADLFSVDELLSCCSASVPALERMWAQKKGVPVNGARAGFKQFLGPLLVEKRTAPTLRRVAQ